MGRFIPHLEQDLGPLINSPIFKFVLKSTPGWGVGILVFGALVGLLWYALTRKDFGSALAKGVLSLFAIAFGLVGGIGLTASLINTAVWSQQLHALSISIFGAMMVASGLLAARVVRTERLRQQVLKKEQEERDRLEEAKRAKKTEAVERALRRASTKKKTLDSVGSTARGAMAFCATANRAAIQVAGNGWDKVRSSFKRST